MQKEVMFMHDGQHYFIQQVKPLIENVEEKDSFLKVLENQGIRQVFEVYEDVRNRYLTILIDQPIPENCLSKLPEGAAFRQGNQYPYVLEQQTIIMYDPEWLAIVAAKWEENQ
jgi:hypothetical protein